MRSGPLTLQPDRIEAPTFDAASRWRCQGSEKDCRGAARHCVCTVGRSSGKLVSLMGVLRPGTGKLQSGSAGLD